MQTEIINAQIKALTDRYLAQLFSGDINAAEATMQEIVALQDSDRERLKTELQGAIRQIGGSAWTETAPLRKRQPKGMQLNGWDV